MYGPRLVVLEVYAFIYFFRGKARQLGEEMRQKESIKLKGKHSVRTADRYLMRVLTYSMVQSPSSEANWFAASQEIPRISRNPKVHHCTHKHPPPISILGPPNPVHK